MEVRFMDSHFNTTKIVDAYTSCIWNVEYIGYGDLELCIPMDLGSYTGIEIGGYASIRESDRYMYIEGMSITTDVTEGNLLIVTGRSLECLLSFRVIRYSSILTGNLQSCIMRLLNSCAINADNKNRYLPGLAFKMSTDPKITAVNVNFEIAAGDNLYDVIYAICDSYKIGFRILPLNDGMMEFELYSGEDRSYDQLERPWIVFSPKFENLNSSEMTNDTSNWKTTAYAEFTYKLQQIDDEGNVTEIERTMYIEVGGDAKDFHRREIFVNVNVSVDKVDIDQFGKPEDRVNMMDFMTWEPVYFNSSEYEAALFKWEEQAAAFKPAIKEEKKEWNMLQKVESLEPGWQEAHPNESPYEWVLKTIPGDDAKTIARKNAVYNAFLSTAPKKEDYMEYGWVLGDQIGYDTALKNAQIAINAEFDATVSANVDKAKQSAEEQCRAKLREYETISRFNGEMDPNVQSQFGKDYFLGDLVQIVNEYNIQATTRVTGMMYSQESSSGLIMRPKFESDDEAVFNI